MDKNNCKNRISIIIPNWNGRNFLNDCIDSLLRVSIKHDVILVDNGSNDDSVEFIRKKFPNVKILENNKNFGFAVACNQGARYALKNGAEYILFLNNDTVVSVDFLEKMLEVFNDKNIGIVGCKIFYNDQPNKIWFAGGDFITWRASGKHRCWMREDGEDLKGVRDCDFITGCAMMVRKEVFNEIGFFYEPYFLGVEDLDFCYFAKKRGWGIKINLDASIYHKVSFSREGEFSFSNGYYGTRNRLFMAFSRTKNYSGGMMLILAVIPVRLIEWIIKRRFSMIKGTFFGVVDFFKGKSGKF